MVGHCEEIVGSAHPTCYDLLTTSIQVNAAAVTLREDDPLLARLNQTTIVKFSATIKPSIQPKAHHGQYLHQS